MSVLETTGLVPDDVLLEYVRQQRWFGAKGSDVQSLRVLDRSVLREELPVLVDAIVEVVYGSGTHDVYQLVLGVRQDDEAIDGVIASRDGWTTYDAPADPAFAHELLHLMRSGATLPAGEGSIEFCSQGSLRAEGDVDVRAIGLEQTNSSIVLNDELIVKVYRRLEAGTNPELELLRFFAAHGFDHVPALRGWWCYSGQALNATLGITQDFIRGAVDGWTFALEELPANADAFAARVERLGTVLGEMHTVLASEPNDPAFCPEKASQESLALLAATVDDQIEQLFLDLPDSEAVAPIAGRGDSVRDLLRGLATVGSIGKRIRHHGDLHLGQAIWADGDWLIIDFEGEPARPLPERRLKASPLRDVAGMLRSFTYAVRVAGVDADVERRARERFLSGYYAAVKDAGILPPPETTARLLRIFELEKAVYELRYELAHRPDWVPVPVAGIVRLLEEGE